MRIISSVAELGPATPGQNAELLVDRLLPLTRSALDRAGVAARDIDLIVTLSLALEGVACDPAIVGPRFGHPMQRALGAERAYVFDLADSSLAKALHVVDVFAWAQGYRHVLVLRGDNAAGLDLSECNGLTIAAGAAAMVAVPDGQSRLTRAPIPGVTPLVFAINPHIRHPRDIKATPRFAPPADFAALHRHAVDSALAKLGLHGAGQVVESWFPEPGGAVGTGPFALPLALGHFLAEHGRGQLAAASFDPFAPAVDAVSLEFGGAHDA